MTKMTELRPDKTGLHKCKWVTHLLKKIIFDHSKKLSSMFYIKIMPKIDALEELK